MVLILIVILIAALVVGGIVWLLFYSGRVVGSEEKGEARDLEDTRAARQQLEEQAERDERLDRELGND